MLLFTQNHQHKKAIFLSATTSYLTIFVTLPELATLYVDKMSSLLSFTLLIIGLVFLSTSEALDLRHRFGGGGGFGFSYSLKLGGGREQGGGGEQEVEEEVGGPCKPAVPRLCGKKTLLSGPEMEKLDGEKFGYISYSNEF